MIDLEQVRLHTRIEKNVDTNHLEAGHWRSGARSRSVDDISVKHQEGSNAQEGGFSDETDIFPDFLSVEKFTSVFLFELSEGSRDCSLGTGFIMIFIDVVYELAAVLVERIVGKVHVELVEVLFRGILIRFCRHSSQAFAMNIEAKREDTCEENVDAEIKLVSSEKKRVGDVFLDDTSVVWDV
jgi:hypothetical protein